MSTFARWAIGLLAAMLAIVGPIAFHRYLYVRHKRLREVTPGMVYRSGQMTAAGFQDAVTRLGIKTIINLQNEYPDPDIRTSWLGSGTIKESELCRQIGARYVFIKTDLLSRRRAAHERPAALEHFLDVMDDPANYPVLVHCRAGLHRTGVMLAAYRINYEGWTSHDALRELRQHGFGLLASTTANDYIVQYVLNFRPRSSQ